MITAVAEHKIDGCTGDYEKGRTDLLRNRLAVCAMLGDRFLKDIPERHRTLTGRTLPT
jgi:hypothetical protein